MKTERLFQIVYYLLEKKSVTAPELAEKLSVSVRTVYRDVEALSMAGVPIYCIAGNGGGISLMPGFTIDKALLTEEEWRQILYALQSIKVADENVEKLVSKIGTVCGKQEADWIEVDFSRWGHSKEDNMKFNTLRQAIIQKRIIEIQYIDAHGKQSIRKLEPVRLVFRNANWYVHGYCQSARNFRCFKMNRIVEIEVTDMIFHENYGEVPDLEVKGDLREIYFQLRISAKMAYRAFDDFGESHIQREKDGSVILSAKIPYDNWIITYILSYGTNVEILKPLWLKDEMKYNVKKLAEFYET